mmetsp:Transcript_17824/g.24691  ORF Transcript_17824/g.24691 Transcript_17824/m.24691 type:complete len:317 (+) Transcript_17824:294-1244(+)
MNNDNPADSDEQKLYVAEYKLLTDFLVSVPKISKEIVETFIKNAESPSTEEVPDIRNYISIHQKIMPKLTGYKAYAISSVLRNQSENIDRNIVPDVGITPDDLTEEELQPMYFVPNFIRPLPEEEIDENANADEYEISQDAIYLVPGMLPEPYWDFNMGQELNYGQMKKYLDRACKMPLKENEQKHLVKGLNTDKELVFHIGMSPKRLPDLVIHNANIAYELLICMTHTSEITKYYDTLSSMKLSTNSLEVFNRLSQYVELPKEFIQLFLKNCMSQCNTSNETKVNKNRLVRLVIVFLQSILKLKMINLNDIFCDI